MLEALDYFREFNTVSVLLRLTLAMFLGGMIGLERGFKGRPAGFRTYLIVCLGAALTMLLSQYNYVMMNTAWAETAALAGVRTDVADLAPRSSTASVFWERGPSSLQADSR